MAGESLADSDRTLDVLEGLSEEDVESASVSAPSSSCGIKKKAKVDLAEALNGLGESMKHGMMAMAARPVENSHSSAQSTEILHELRAMNASQSLINGEILKALQKLAEK